MIYRLSPDLKEVVQQSTMKEPVREVHWDWNQYVKAVELYQEHVKALLRFPARGFTEKWLGVDLVENENFEFDGDGERYYVAFPMGQSFDTEAEKFAKDKQSKMHNEITLEDLPAGSLFKYGETIALKSEYRADGGAIEAYIVGSGEMFWGGTKTSEDQRKLLVVAVAIPATEETGDGDLISALENIMALPGEWNEAKQIARRAIGDYKYPANKDRMIAGASSQKQEIEGIEEMADIGFAASEAIEFGEFILKHKIAPVIISQEWKWASRNVNDPVLGYYGEATTLQLYQKFKDQP